MTGNPNILKARVKALVLKDLGDRAITLPTKAALVLAVAGCAILVPNVEFAEAQNVWVAEDAGNRFAAEAGADPDVDPSVNSVARRVDPLVASIAVGLDQTAPPIPAAPRTPSTPEPGSSPTTPEPAAIPSVPEAPSYDLVGHAHTLKSFLVTEDAEFPGSIRMVQRENSKMSGDLTVDGVRLSYSTKGIFDIADDLSKITYVAPQARVEIEYEDDDGATHLMRYQSVRGALSRTYEIDGEQQDVGTKVIAWEKKAWNKLIKEQGVMSHGYIPYVFKKKGTSGILSYAGEVSSEYHQRNILTSLLLLTDLSDREVAKFVKIVKTMDSDYEKRLALMALMAQQGLDDGVGDMVVEAAATIDSDYEVRVLISSAFDTFNLSDKISGYLLEIAEGIDSDYEFRVAVNHMLESGVTAETARKLIGVAAKKLDSDYESRLLLEAYVSGDYGKEQAELGAVIPLLRRMGSDYETRQVIQKAVKNTSYQSKDMKAMLEIVGNLGSDFEKRIALQSIRQHLRGSSDSGIISAYNDAVETLSGQERKRVRRIDSGAR